MTRSPDRETGSQAEAAWCKVEPGPDPRRPFVPPPWARPSDVGAPPWLHRNSKEVVLILCVARPCLSLLGWRPGVGCPRPSSALRLTPCAPSLLQGLGLGPRPPAQRMAPRLARRAPRRSSGALPRPLQRPLLCSPDGRRRQALQETLVFLLPLEDPPPKVRQAGSPKEWALGRPCHEEDGGPPQSWGAGGPRGLPLKDSPPPLPALCHACCGGFRLTRGISACPCREAELH